MAKLEKEHHCLSGRSPTLHKKREHELSVHNCRIYRISQPEGFVIIGPLAPETLPYMIYSPHPCGSPFGPAKAVQNGSCHFVCSSARTFALGLPPHSTSRGCTCRRLVVIIDLLRTMPVSHRGLAPHKFMPMPGVPMLPVRSGSSPLHPTPPAAARLKQALYLLMRKSASFTIKYK